MQPPLVRAHPFPAHPWLPSTLQSPSTNPFLVQTTSTTSFIGQRPDRARNIESPPSPCHLSLEGLHSPTTIFRFSYFHLFLVSLPNYHLSPFKVIWLINTTVFKTQFYIGTFEQLYSNENFCSRTKDPRAKRDKTSKRTL